MAKRITEYIDNHNSGGQTAQKQLRQLVERYPYYQAARLLMLRSLYETHDPSFGQELRQAAIYVPSRRVLYNLIEADRLKPKPETAVRRLVDDDDSIDRTNSLIDNFLSTLPEEEEKPRRRNARTTVDAATDYMGYMMQVEADNSSSAGNENMSYGQHILDNFLELGKITIQDHPDEELQRPEEVSNSEVLTETLAQIYIKQGKYDKALEIIQRLSLKYPKKNRYFADQMRYLRKLIENNNNK